LRAHADLIDPVGFEDFLAGPAAGLDFDLLLEAKAKDLALRRLRDQLVERGWRWEEGRLRPPAS
jgi:UV DNA damage endonuclease